MDELTTDILIELHVSNFDDAKSFYGSIGYEVVWEKQPNDNEGGYLVMRNGKSILNFYGGQESVWKHDFFSRFSQDTPRGYGVEIIVPIVDIEKFYEEFCKNHKGSIVKELNHKFSHKDFRATDPYGFYIRFVEKYNWVDDRDENGKLLDA